MSYHYLGKKLRFYRSRSWRQVPLNLRRGVVIADVAYGNPIRFTVALCAPCYLSVWWWNKGHRGFIIGKQNYSRSRSLQPSPPVRSE